MSRPAIRDTLLTIESRVEVTEFTEARIRCGACANVFVISRRVEAALPGCAPMPALPRTSACRRCGRICRTDTANMPEMAPW